MRRRVASRPMSNRIEELARTPGMAAGASPANGGSVVGKRSFDCVFATAALIVTLPLCGAIAVAIWLEDRGPVLFRQDRVGLDGRVFRMLKFRSMVDRAEARTGPVFAHRDDPRRTRVGRILRRSSLDELPQLWNVIVGDMSLVGPRPERPVFIERFRSEIPGYMLRHRVESGMTGWAQVHGWRGDTSLRRRVEHDLYYIRNRSLWLDLRILLQTLWRGIFGANAY